MSSLNALSMIARAAAGGRSATGNVERHVEKSDTELAAVAQKYLRMRRKRGDFFGADLFADPAWEILLDLFAAGIEGRVVSITSACIASGVPTTTALRWITLLVSRGAVCRAPDARDHRRSHLYLSTEAKAVMAEWLRALSQAYHD
ncbi:MarR family transcriptional regulator [Sphingomonas sp. JC676]|uniref:MarR family transcriptional regulator n=1 Tax=Sphingomonas sp. JC676 TaxID=2768065 RepID=UPI0016585032|nr:MarR family transcriptional regulator [Sphingomonas sp. JC676]